MAVKQGDRYVVNGQKVWISRIQHSDLMLLLARTTPLPEVTKKTEGLSIFLVDLRGAEQRGMTVRPIRNMVNHETNEVFFEDFEVPAENLIGEEGKGFRYILDGMNAERILIAAECIGDGYWFIDRARHYASFSLFDLPEGAIALRGDATRLTQALLNLLTNAAKYTPEHGRIVLKVVVEDGMVVASVTDNGRGVAPEAQERIFDLFTQERPATGTTDPGLGIGLALARVLIEQHGGQLTVESAGVGQGSTFRIRLPIVEARRHRRGPAAAPGAQAAKTRAEPLRVLVVDDNRDAADMLTSLLAALGHESRARLRRPRRARDGARVRAGRRLPRPQHARRRRHQPAAAAAGDLRRRGARGRAHRLRPAARPRHTRAAGFQEHLTKPVDVARLEATLATAAAARR